MTGTRALAVLSAVLLLAGCSSDPTPSSSGSRSPAPAASSVSGRDIGLQLRPVLDASGSTGTTCATSSPSTNAPAAQTPVTACSTDGTIVYSLGPAVVTGDQWESLRVVDDPGSQASEILALLDPPGSSAFTQATAQLATESEPRNQIAFYFQGRVESAPSVQQPIYGGQVVIGSGLDHAGAQALLDRIVG